MSVPVRVCVCKYICMCILNKIKYMAAVLFRALSRSHTISDFPVQTGDTRRVH